MIITYAYVCSIPTSMDLFTKISEQFGVIKCVDMHTCGEVSSLLFILY
jgi:hypothetical protein